MYITKMKGENMNYTYDILANFNETYYEFFEWNNKDELTHIKKLPIIKVDKNVLLFLFDYYIAML